MGDSAFKCYCDTCKRVMVLRPLLSLSKKTLRFLFNEFAAYFFKTVRESNGHNESAGLNQVCLNRPSALAFFGQSLYWFELYSVNKGGGLLFGSFSPSKASVEIKSAAVQSQHMIYYLLCILDFHPASALLRGLACTFVDALAFCWSFP